MTSRNSKNCSFRRLPPSSPLLLGLHLLILLLKTSGSEAWRTQSGPKASPGELRTPMDCFSANRTCFHPRSAMCRNSIMILYRVCGRSWKYCETKNLHFCLSHLQSVRMTTVFENCNCQHLPSPQFEQCDNLYRLIHKNPCELKPAPKRPAGMDAGDVFVDLNGIYTNGETEKKLTYQQLPTNGQLEEVGVKTDNGEGPSCLSVLRVCDESTRCQVLRADFVNKCRLSVCKRNSDDCLNTYEAIRLFNVFKCTCLKVPPGSQAACKAFRSQFVENKCLAFMNSQTLYGSNRKPWPQRPKVRPSPKAEVILPPAVVPSKPKPEERKMASSPSSGTGPDPSASRPEKPTTPVPTTQVSCFDVYSSCARWSSCLERMLRVFEFCRRRSTGSLECSNRGRCLEALKDFYSNMGIQQLSLRALYCNCQLTDRDCLAKRELFRPACAYQEQSGTCLSLIRECYADVECRGRYHRFRTECLENDFDRTCNYTPDKCLDAYRTLWGSNLTQRCSCDPAQDPIHINGTRPRLNRYKITCLRIKELHQSPPCLRGKYIVGFADPVVRGQGVSTSAVKLTAAQRSQAACRKRIGPGVKEASIRLYHNDSCSDLCQCSALGQVRCRVLPCSNTRPCPRNDAARRSPDCSCVFGHWLCPPASERWQRAASRPRGLFLHVSYSPAERRLLQQHGPPADLGNLSRTLTWILNSSTGGISRLCQLHLEEEMPSSVVYRVRLLDNAAGPDGNDYDNVNVGNVEIACRYPILLLRLMIESGDPAIRSHPHLSLMRRARVLDGSREANVHTGSCCSTPHQFLLFLLLLLLNGWRRFEATPGASD